MSSLKILKQRISSIRATQKITKAMQLVSAAKLKKVKDTLEHSRQYAKTVEDIFNIIVSESRKTGRYSAALDQILHFDNNTPNLLIIFGSERGLCGSFNAYILRKFLHKLKELESMNQETKVIVIGNKACEILKNKIPDNIVNTYSSIKDINKSSEEIAEYILQNYNPFKCFLCFNYFKNNLLQVPVIENLFQYEKIPYFGYLNPSFKIKNSQDNINPNSANQQNFSAEQMQYDIEGETLEESIIYKHAYAKLKSILTSSKVSEEAIRMMSMDGATKNANKIIDNLSLQFNRQRQSMITTELIEIIAGAETLNKQ